MAQTSTKLIIFLIFSILVLIIYYVNLQRNFVDYRKQFESPVNATKKIPTSIISEVKETENKTIIDNVFFIETSFECDNSEKLFLDCRQSCSLESAAKLNPHMNIVVQFASKIKRNNDLGTLSPLLKILLDNYKNINLTYINIFDYSKQTPIEKFFEQRTFEHSLYPVPHLSDVLRVLTLWKYGGTYLDLDVIVQKPLDSIPKNYAGLEDKNSIGSSVLNVDRDGIGHKMMTDSINSLMETFDGTKWAENGPVVMSNAIRRLCRTRNLSNLKTNVCEGFHVLPQSAFYSIHYDDHRFFYEPGNVDDVMRRVKDSIAVHIWNHFEDIDRAIPVTDTRVPLIRLAWKFCPITIKNCGQYF